MSSSLLLGRVGRLILAVMDVLSLLGPESPLMRLTFSLAVASSISSHWTCSGAPSPFTERRRLIVTTRSVTLSEAFLIMAVAFSPLIDDAESFPEEDEEEEEEVAKLRTSCWCRRWYSLEHSMAGP